MKAAIEEFINGKSLAIVGLSRSGKKFGNAVYSELAKRGYEVFAVHPDVTEIADIPCYPDLAALPGKVDGVVVCISPPEVPGVLKAAGAAGLKKIWLQQGAESAESIALAKDLGLELVHGRCILMYAPPVEGFHAWHRAFHRIVARY